MKTFPVHDSVSLTELQALGLDVRAKVTGEFRPPKAGEWYLSGAIVGAYRAHNDLVCPYHIAHLYVVKSHI